LTICDGIPPRSGVIGLGSIFHRILKIPNKEILLWSGTDPCEGALARFEKRTYWIYPEVRRQSAFTPQSTVRGVIHPLDGLRFARRRKPYFDAQRFQVLHGAGGGRFIASPASRSESISEMNTREIRQQGFLFSVRFPKGRIGRQ